MAADTITCPHCGATEPTVAVRSEATYVWSVMATAEIDIATDLVRDDKLKINVQHEWQGGLGRVLNEFRRDDNGGDADRLSLDDWHELWLDHPELIAYCWQCQGDVTTEFRALLDARVPIDGDREPTDNEIYNRAGVEGGIAYDLTADIPGSLGENDWRL